MTFRILTVCTGNICRSPQAEQLLRLGLASVPDIEVASAGTMAMVGRGQTPQSAAIARTYGVTDAEAHVARQLEESMVREADLILGLAREHRRAVAELVPAAVRRTFTLREFAQLAASVTDADLDDSRSPLDGDGLDAKLRAAVLAAASLRGVVPPFENPDDADVVDPYRQSDAVYRLSADQLVAAAGTTVRLLQKAASRA